MLTPLSVMRETQVRLPAIPDWQQVLEQSGGEILILIWDTHILMECLDHPAIASFKLCCLSTSVATKRQGPFLPLLRTNTQNGVQNLEMFTKQFFSAGVQIATQKLKFHFSLLSSRGSQGAVWTEADASLRDSCCTKCSATFGCVKG